MQHLPLPQGLMAAGRGLPQPHSAALSYKEGNQKRALNGRQNCEGRKISSFKTQFEKKSTPRGIFRKSDTPSDPVSSVVRRFCFARSASYLERVMNLSGVVKQTSKKTLAGEEPEMEAGEALYRGVCFIFRAN